MKYYNYEFNYRFLSVGLTSPDIFTCYCGGQAWLSAGTWFNDTYVMNCFYQLFFSQPLMSNNVPTISNWVWLPAVGPSRSTIQLATQYNTLPKSKVNMRIFFGNFRQRRKRLTGSSSTQYFSPLRLFCLLTSVRPHHLLPIDWSEAWTAEKKHLVSSIINCW